jgi:coenzyme PQQ precursor peptide PqqA
MKRTGRVTFDLRGDGLENRRRVMERWTTPKLREITLGAEITAYVNTDVPGEHRPERPDEPERAEVRADAPAATAGADRP